MKTILSLYTLGMLTTIAIPAALADKPEPSPNVVSGNIYSVSIESNTGTFEDCFRFNEGGTLIIDGLGFPIAYAQGTLQPRIWQADGNDGTGFSIGFSGNETLGSFVINGQGINSDGDTFVVGGVFNPNCSVPTPVDGQEANWR